MKRPGAVALGEVAKRAEALNVQCSRCDRRGHYQLARLVSRFGPDFPMTDLGDALANCPRRNATGIGERCDVFFPNLAEIMTNSPK